MSTSVCFWIWGNYIAVLFLSRRVSAQIHHVTWAKKKSGIADLYKHLYQMVAYTEFIQGICQKWYCSSATNYFLLKVLSLFKKIYWNFNRCHLYFTNDVLIRNLKWGILFLSFFFFFPFKEIFFGLYLPFIRTI